MRILIALSVLFAVSAIAAGHDIVWSSYSADLNVKSIDDKNDVIWFSGHITVTGELVFEFEGDGGERDLLWVKLIPDVAELPRFPQVVGGFYPAPLKYLWIRNTDGLLELAFGRKLSAEYSRGHDIYISRRGTFVLGNFAASVECDSREYSASVVRILDRTPQTLLANEPRRDIDGC